MKSIALAGLVLALLKIAGQQPVLTTTAEGRRVTVTWGAGQRVGGDWIGLYRVGAPVEPFPPAPLWRYVPAGESGELVFEAPDSGEWEARYLSAGNLALATARVVISDSAPVRSRLRKLSYFENGTLLWESETMDDTEASRHLANVSLSDRKSFEARIEVRYATVTYPAQPDEVGTWRK